MRFLFLLAMVMLAGCGSNTESPTPPPAPTPPITPRPPAEVPKWSDVIDRCIKNIEAARFGFEKIKVSNYCNCAIGQIAVMNDLYYFLDHSASVIREAVATDLLTRCDTAPVTTDVVYPYIY